MKRSARLAPLRGFTLIEVTLATAIVGLVVACLAWAGITLTAVTQRVSSTATLQSQARLGLDALMRDVHAADLVLVSSGSYSSSTSGVLVLELPSYDSSGNVLSGKYDQITYHLVGSSAPYTLNRVVAVATGSARTAKTDTVIARNVQSLTLQYLCSQTISSGDGTTTRFALTAPVYGSGAGLVETVNNTGTALTVTTGTPTAGQAQFLAASVSPSFPQGSILFGTAPATGASVGLSYTVNPTSATAAPQVTQVAADLKVGTSDGSLGQSGTETVELVDTTNLHNH